MSKNSPGVCINDGESIKFKSFYRGKPSKKESTNFNLFESKDDLFVHYNSNKRPSKMEYIEQERWNINDAIQAANNIVNNLPDGDYKIGLEGFSYGSKGNAGLDIAGYAYVLRTLLINKYGSDNLFIFAPSEIKKIAGKGNANKVLMYDFFKNETCEILAKNSLFKAIQEGTIDENEKPIDDIIDSYWIHKTLLKHLENK